MLIEKSANAKLVEAEQERAQGTTNPTTSVRFLSIAPLTLGHMLI